METEYVPPYGNSFRELNEKSDGDFDVWILYEGSDQYTWFNVNGEKFKQLSLKAMRDTRLLINLTSFIKTLTTI